MAKRKRLSPLVGGKEWEAYMGFTDDEPFARDVYDQYDDSGVPHREASIYLTRRDARRRFEDVRRVRIIVEGK